MDPSRYRYPIKLYRSDSPASTLSSRRPSYRTDTGGFPPSGSHPPHRATSEPPPEGPIQLQWMELSRTPSRTYLDPPDYPYYPPPPPPPPPHGYYRSSRPRHFYDQSGYESDITRVYPPRPIFRSDGYETDSGLISSGRIRMTRTLPNASSTSRMAVIPENNRMYPRREKKSANDVEHEVPIRRDERMRPEDLVQLRRQPESATVIPITAEDEQKVERRTREIVFTGREISESDEDGNSDSSGQLDRPVESDRSESEDERENDGGERKRRMTRVFLLCSSDRAFVNLRLGFNANSFLSLGTGSGD